MSNSPDRIQQHIQQAKVLVGNLVEAEGVSERIARQAVMATIQSASAEGISLYDTGAFLTQARQVVRGIEEIARRAAPRNTVAEPWRPRRVSPCS